MPTLISQVFANQGNLQVIPQADTNGFVAFNTGYTSDYEINLAAGNPNAKAVERTSMNWMFNMITDNLQFIQNHGSQQWMTVPDGYPKGAVVVNNTGSESTPDWRIFMSVVEANMSSPPANGETSTWQELQLPSDSRQYLLMPQGGDAANPYMSRGVQSTPIDFNTITTSTALLIQNDTVAAGSLNLPTSIGQIKMAGLLEVVSWTVTPAVFTIQRYTNVQGYVFARYGTANTWTNWIYNMSVADVQLGRAVIGSTTGATALAVTLDAGYAWPPLVGSELILVNNVNTTGPVTLTIGTNTKTLFGFDNQPLPAGAIVAGLPYRVQWDGAAWRLVYAHGAPQVGFDAVDDNNFVTKRQLDAVAAKILTFNDIFDKGTTIFRADGTDPNVKLGPLGQTWTRLPDNMVIRTSAANHTALAQGGADSQTMTAAMLIAHTHSINITSNNSGPWNSITGDSGGHGHTGLANDAGSHSHNMQTAGNHFHDSGWGEAYPQFARYGTYDNTRGNYGSGKADWDNYKYNTSTNGDHTHIIFDSGTHAHSLNINWAGVHSHQYSLPAHNHTFNGNTGIGGSATPQAIPTLPRYVTLNGWYRST